MRSYGVLTVKPAFTHTVFTISETMVPSLKRYFIPIEFRIPIIPGCVNTPWRRPTRSQFIPSHGRVAKPLTNIWDTRTGISPTPTHPTPPGMLLTYIAGVGNCAEERRLRATRSSSAATEILQVSMAVGQIPRRAQYAPIPAGKTRPPPVTTLRCPR